MFTFKECQLTSGNDDLGATAFAFFSYVEPVNVCGSG